MRTSHYGMTFMLFFLTNCVQIFAQRGPGEDTPAHQNPQQINLTPTMTAPNITSLGVFGDIKVAKYLGHPEISVPLFDIKNNGISLPVSLDYNVSVVKPDSHPGWAGLGWAMNVFGGGVISRKIRDKNDENDRPFADRFIRETPPIYPGGGFYSQVSRTYLQGSDWDTATPDIRLASQYDTEPDEFSFMINGYSGKFFLDEQGKWQVRCDQHITVEFLDEFIMSPFPVPNRKTSEVANSFFYYKPTLRAFKRFILTDDQGIRYFFGGSNDSIEYNLTYNSQNWDDWLATSWHITQVVWPDGRQLDFSYERGKLLVDLQVIQSYSVTGAYINGTQDCAAQVVSDPIGGQVISPIYLTSVKSSWGDFLDFYSSKCYDPFYAFDNVLIHRNENYYATRTSTIREFSGDILDLNNDRMGSRKLDSIRWGNSSGTLKTVRLNYTTQTPYDQRGRLMLYSVTEVSGEGLAQKPYRFAYSIEESNNDNFPAYLSEKSDHWGFYSNMKSSVLDSAELYPAAYYQSRSATTDEIVLHTNLLTRMVYPTGGSTNFTYEQGSYKVSLDSTRQGLLNHGLLYGGGPRIKTITDNDGRDNVVGNNVRKKNYYYVKGYLPGGALSSFEPSGILNGVPKYSHKYKEDYNVTYPNGATDNIKVDYSLKTSNEVIPINDEFYYNPIGYSEVVEMEMPAASSLFGDINPGNGYKITKYTGFEDNHFDDPATLVNPAFFPDYPVSSRAFERGRQKSEEIYTHEGRLVESHKISWGSSTIGADINRPLCARSKRISSFTRCSYLTPIGSGSQYDSFEVGAYRLYYYSFRPLREETVKYYADGSASVPVVSDFSYDEKYSVLREKTVNGSRGERYKTRYRYPFDIIPYIPQEPSVNPYSYMCQSNMIGTPVETITSTVSEGTEKITSVMVNSLKMASVIIPGTGVKRLPLPSAGYVLKSPNGIPTYQYQNYHVNFLNGYEEEVFDPKLNSRLAYAYDAWGKIAQVLKVDAGLPQTVQSYLWGYNSQYPVAEVKNAGSGDFAFTSFEWGKDTGGWTYQDSVSYDTQRIPGIIKVSSAVTGENVFFCSTLNHTITKDGLDPAKSYILSFYSNVAIPNINGTLKASRDILGSDMKYYEYEVNGASSIDIDGPERTYIDELRLYPTDAQMATWTYTPAIGMTSATDANGQTIYYEYDGYHRLRCIRDVSRNIVKQFDYHYKDQ
ncbi:hypothetical protein ACUN24_20970 [Pedobacter sp. WC2501]|uniref:hypothetical protein n=1 Tax=Pedobacter sp. WC2501 TaxID=3461400 RepID=UPI0040464D3A